MSRRPSPQQSRGRVGLVNAAWTPLSLPGVNLWLRADMGVTGTSPVTAWADQSGHGNNAAATGSWVFAATGGPNSQPCIQKPTVGHMIVPYAVGLHPTVGVGFVIVWRFSSVSHNSNCGILCTTSSSGWADGWNFVNGPAVTAGLMEFWVDTYNTHYVNNTIYDNTTWHATSGVYDSSAPTLNLYESNVAATNKVGDTTAGVIAYSSNSQLTIGSYTNAGGTGAVTDSPDIDIAEVIVCGVMSAGDRTSLQAYLNKRYAL